MAIAVLLRRVSEDEVVRGPAHLESRFEATMDDDVFDAEAEAGVLCSLGREWAFVQLALTGRMRAGDVRDLVVLGGEPLGPVGPTDHDMIIVLSPAQVAEAAAYLRDIDPPTLIERHREALAERSGGVLPEGFLAEIREYLDNLRRFYAAAAEAGQAVAKRTYT